MQLERVDNNKLLCPRTVRSDTWRYAFIQFLTTKSVLFVTDAFQTNSCPRFFVIPCEYSTVSGYSQYDYGSCAVEIRPNSVATLYRPPARPPGRRASLHVGHNRTTPSNTRTLRAGFIINVPLSPYLVYYFP